MKYIIMTGGVMSGLGKGIAVASMGKILQSRGFKVTAIKIDPYLNSDAGTINPFEHGEVFVTDDGGEIDLDMGHYERFLGISLTKMHNITTGQVYGEVIRRERRGDYLGQTVQIIPHVTDLIKGRVRRAAEEGGAEACLVEIGGTVGDMESMPFIEAMRQLSIEEGREGVAFVHLTLVPVLDAVGEQKTKPTQHSVKQLLEAGISPDFLICRASAPLSEGAKRKISLFCNVPENAVISDPDMENVYRLPLLFEEQGLGELLLKRLSLKGRRFDMAGWKRAVDQMDGATEAIRIAIVGKYVRFPDTYLSVNEALKHAAASCDRRVEISWIDSEVLEGSRDGLLGLRDYDGILIPGGFGQRGSEGKITAISYARAHGVPFLGICFGFQLAVVEFARGIGLKGANSTELDPKTPHPVVCILPGQAKTSNMGGTLRLGAHAIQVERGTTAFRSYGRVRIEERHRHRFEVNPTYIGRLSEAGLKFSGRSADGRRMEILELPGHPFFLATQFHPEFKSRPGKPSPVFESFIRAVIGSKAK